MHWNPGQWVHSYMLSQAGGGGGGAPATPPPPPPLNHQPPTDTIFSARRSASLSEMGWCLSSTRVRLSRPASWYVGGAGLEGGRSCSRVGWGAA